MALLRLVGLLHRVSWSSTVRPQGFRSFRPQKARKRAARTEARGASTPGDYRKVPFGVSNEGCREAAPAQARRTAASCLPDTPREYLGLGARLPCGAGPGRCYDASAHGRRDALRATPVGTPGPAQERSPSLLGDLHLSIEPVRVRFRRAQDQPPSISSGPERPDQAGPSVGYTTHLARGPRGASRSPSRRPTSRRGCGIPRWSRWTTPGSGSPSRTASRRTGSRRAIAP